MDKWELPEFIQCVPQLADLLAAEKLEIERLEGYAETTLGEFAVATMTVKTADIWERSVGYEPAPDWEIERRRERVRARLLGGGTATKARIKEIVETLAMTTVEIAEQADAATVTIKFIGIYGVSPYPRGIGGLHARTDQNGRNREWKRQLITG